MQTPHTEYMTNGKIDCVMLTYAEGLPMVTHSVVSSHVQNSHAHTDTHEFEKSVRQIISILLYIQSGLSV